VSGISTGSTPRSLTDLLQKVVPLHERRRRPRQALRVLSSRPGPTDLQGSYIKHFQAYERGESFGPSWSTHWFKIQLTVPKDMRHGEHLEFKWDAQNEGLVWTEDGNPLQGLTGGGERIE
jgi:alpha-mannosidase